MLSIDKNLLAAKTKRIVRKADFQRLTTPLSRAKNIGVLFCVEDKAKHQSINEFVNKLHKEGKNVHVLCYLPKGKENYEFRFDFFSRSDLSFWGNFTSPLVDDFLAKEYDYLFSIDQKTHFLIDNIIARSKAKCRIGLYQERHIQNLEMMLSLEDYKDIGKVLDQIYHYTSELQK